MRRFLTPAIVLVTLACAAWLPAALANAPGEQTVPVLSGSAGPTMDRVGARPKSVALSVDLGFRSMLADQLPATLARAELWFTRGAVVNGRLFPSCTAARLAANRRCPRGSLLGRAQIDAAVGTVADRLDVPLTADLYNGPRGRSVVFHFRASQPVSIDVPVQAPLVPVRERFYGYKLTVPVPENLQAPAGLETSVLRFRVTVKGTVRRGGRRRGWIETSLCPRGAGADARALHVPRRGPEVRHQQHRLRGSAAARLSGGSPRGRRPSSRYACTCRSAIALTKTSSCLVVQHSKTPSQCGS